MKNSLTNFRKIFTYLELGIYTLLLVILLQLGIWQLHRANEKKMILHEYQKRARQAELLWDAGKIKPAVFQKVVVQGKQSHLRFYLDNQFFNHHLGYDVLFPLQLKDDSILLVDAGWVMATANRQDLPMIPIHPKKYWAGQVYYPATHPIQLGRLIDHQQNQIYVIESIDFAGLEKILKHPIHPWVLRLNPEDSGKYQRNWQIINMTPERHQAYALQWFTMALVVGVIFLWRVIQYAKQ